MWIEDEPEVPLTKLQLAAIEEAEYQKQLKEDREKGILITAEEFERRKSLPTKRKHRAYRELTGDSLKRYLLNSAKHRARQTHKTFNISIEDIDIPEVCPLWGIKMKSNFGFHVGIATESSPSIDRIDNRRGYVKGNVWVICRGANKRKGSMSLDKYKEYLTPVRLELITLLYGK